MYALRDYVTLMLDNRARFVAEKRKATGVDESFSEIDQLLDDMIDQRRDVIADEVSKSKKKVAEDKMADEMRKRASGELPPPFTIDDSSASGDDAEESDSRSRKARPRGRKRRKTGNNFLMIGKCIMILSNCSHLVTHHAVNHEDSFDGAIADMLRAQAAYLKERQSSGATAVNAELVKAQAELLRAQNDAERIELEREKIQLEKRSLDVELEAKKKKADMDEKKDSVFLQLLTEKLRTPPK